MSDDGFIAGRHAGGNARLLRKVRGVVQPGGVVAILDIRRFFALDRSVYEEGALPVRTKELLGLVASLVLRCDDCISYHVIRCREEGIDEGELMEALPVALVVGAGLTRSPSRPPGSPGGDR